MMAHLSPIPEGQVRRSEFDHRWNRLDSRWNADTEIRRYVHRAKVERICAQLQPGKTLLDVCRGGSVDGVTGVQAAKRGLDVTILNPSEIGLKVIRKFASQEDVEDRINFVQSDPLSIEFPDRSFDVVVSSHVLEHLSDFNRGLSEVRRVTRHSAIVALPTCTNPAVLCRLGGGDPYNFSLRSLLLTFKGSGLAVRAWRQGEDGVDEDMSELGEMIVHRWRFPGHMRRHLEQAGFEITRFEPDSVVLPWFTKLFPVTCWLDNHGQLPVIRDLGMGSHAFVIRNDAVGH